MLGGDAPGPRLRIAFVSGARMGERIDVPAPQPNGSSVLVGRSRECAICIETNDISRRHAEIFASPNGHLLIHDLGSINGTFVNDRAATQTAPMPLYPGDRIKMGHSEILYEGATGPLAQRPAYPQPQMPPPPPPVIQQPQVVLPPTAPMPPSSPSVATPTVAIESLYIYIFLRNGQRYRFDGEEATIGRGQANDIVIDSNSMSRQHARLTRTPAGIFIADLGSTNKTFVNGIAADGPVALRDGDVLRFGDVEADFKLEEQRLSTFFKLSDFMPGGMDHTTERDMATDMTSLGDFGGDTSLDIPGQAPSSQRRDLEEGVTNLHIDLKVVGRSQRQASSPVSDNLPVTGPFDNQVGRGPNPPSRMGVEVARLEGVSFTEGTGRAATQLLRNVRLNLRQGEMVALVGPSGSGKTELLEIMGGMLAADRGFVTVLGYQIPTHENWQGRRRLNLEEERDHVRWRNRNIGYLTSDLNQLNPKLSVLEILTAAIEQAGLITDPRRRQEIAAEKLYLVGLNNPEIPRLKPTDLNRREKRLVALARALVNDAPLLLADEPTGNLPSESATFVSTLLQQFAASGKTVFMVTHDQYWARNATRQIEILDGEIVGGLS